MRTLLVVPPDPPAPAASVPDRVPPSAARSTRDRLDARRRTARLASLAGRRRVRRAALRRLPEDVEIEHELADLLLELLDLLVLERLLVLRPRPQRILRRGQETLLPVFDLGDGQAVLARCLRHRRLTPDDAQHQRYAALRGPPLHVVGHIRHRNPPLRGHLATVVWVASTWRGAV